MDNKPEFLDEDVLQSMLEFLDDLRESGEVNMFGAVPYLETMFPDYLARGQARQVLSYWMNTFVERNS